MCLGKKAGNLILDDSIEDQQRKGINCMGWNQMRRPWIGLIERGSARFDYQTLSRISQNVSHCTESDLMQLYVSATVLSQTLAKQVPDKTTIFHVFGAFCFK